MEVQVFGVQKSAGTRAALRFFKERRIPVHFMDFKRRAPSPGELKRFVRKFGVDGLLDRESRRFAELGLNTAHFGEERWLEWMCAEPLILRTPLVRYQQRLTVGAAEEEWRSWAG